MLLTIDKALSAPRGISLADDLIGLVGGDLPPSEVDGGLPESTIYIRTNGELWQKIGPNTTDWDIFRTGFKEGIIPVNTADGQQIEVPISNGALVVELADGSTGKII